MTAPGPLRAPGGRRDPDAADRSAVFAVMATRPHHRSSRGAFQSFMLGVEAWPDYPAGLAQPRAARALKGLRAEGKVECLGTAGLWRLTEIGEAEAHTFRSALAVIGPHRPAAAVGTGDHP